MECNFFLQMNIQVISFDICIGILVDFAFGSWIQPPGSHKAQVSMPSTEEMCHVQPHDVWWAEGTQISEATLNICKYSGGFIQQFPWSTDSFLITHTSQVMILTILWLGAISIERGVAKPTYQNWFSHFLGVVTGASGYSMALLMVQDSEYSQKSIPYTHCITVHKNYNI